MDDSLYCMKEDEAAAYLIEGSGFVEMDDFGFALLNIKASFSSEELDILQSQ